MAVTDIHKKVIDAMTVMNVAIKNIRLYPSTSAIIRNTVERVHLIFQDIFKSEDSLILSEVGSNFVICGQVFTENEQRQNPQAFMFFETLLVLGLKGVSFERQIGLSELKTFLQIVSKTQLELDAAGGIQKVAEKEKLPNVLLDHKVYVVMEGDQQIVSGLRPEEMELLKRIIRTGQLSGEEKNHLRDTARNPGRLREMMDGGVSYAMSRRGAEPDEIIARDLTVLTRLLDGASDGLPEKTDSSRAMSESLLKAEDRLLAHALGRIHRNEISPELISEFIDFMPAERRAILRDELQRIRHLSPDLVPADSIGALILEEKNGDGEETKTASSAPTKEDRAACLKTGLTRLLSGDEKWLSDPVFLEMLPEYLRHLNQTGKSDKTVSFIRRMADALTLSHPEPRHRAVRTLLSVSAMLEAQKAQSLFADAAPSIMNWMRAETDPPPEYERIATVMADTVWSLNSENRIVQALPVLQVFHELAYGTQESGHTPTGAHRMSQGAAENALSRIGSDSMLSMLMERYQQGNETEKELVIEAFGGIGDTAVSWLIDILQKSRDMSERVRVLRIISDIRHPATGLLARKIREGGPWFYLRNLILALGKIGSPADLHALIPLMNHEDIRVQREALNSIYLIGGEKRGDLLLSAMPHADERLKISMIDMLGALKHRPAVAVLTEMLASKSLFSSRLSEKLQNNVCAALGRIGDPAAVPVLRAVAEQKRLLSLHAYSDNVKETAAAAIDAISSAETRPAAAPAAKPRLQPLSLSPVKSPATVEKDNVPTAAELLDSIRRHIKLGNTNAVMSARERLRTVHTEARAELQAADEMISRVQRTPDREDAVPKDHMGLWPDLYEALSPEEANALYYAMEEQSFSDDETICRQGERSSRLYFVLKGSLKLIFHQGEQENLIRTLSQGDVVGEDTFFSVSVCTTSLIALSAVETTYLDKEVLDRWKTQFPALEAKLHDYCLGLERVQDVLRKKGMDRRLQGRFPITGEVKAQLMRPAGGGSGRFFKGYMENISAGGLSFGISSPNRKNISLLLGRQLELSLMLPMPIAKKIIPSTTIPFTVQQFQLRQLGGVIGVSHRGDNRYMVHVQFVQDLSRLTGNADAEGPPE
ncbi:MAG: hypothetical protein CSB33_03405 [Desulfobacterales bacterium]|nr:MAG: hypothetical protein CSB33_03405 [Desulfobacterales bacterium]